MNQARGAGLLARQFPPMSNLVEEVRCETLCGFPLYPGEPFHEVHDDINIVAGSVAP